MNLNPGSKKEPETENQVKTSEYLLGESDQLIPSVGRGRVQLMTQHVGRSGLDSVAQL